MTEIYGLIHVHICALVIYEIWLMHTVRLSHVKSTWSGSQDFAAAHLRLLNDKITSVSSRIVYFQSYDDQRIYIHFAFPARFTKNQLCTNRRFTDYNQRQFRLSQYRYCSYFQQYTSLWYIGLLYSTISLYTIRRCLCVLCTVTITLTDECRNLIISQCVCRPVTPPKKVRLFQIKIEDCS